MHDAGGDAAQRHNGDPHVRRQRLAILQHWLPTLCRIGLSGVGEAVGHDVLHARNLFIAVLITRPVAAMHIAGAMATEIVINKSGQTNVVMLQAFYDMSDFATGVFSVAN